MLNEVIELGRFSIQRGRFRSLGQAHPGVAAPPLLPSSRRSVLTALVLDLLAVNVRSRQDIAAAFEQASAQKVDGIMTFRDPTVVTYLELIAELCQTHRLPAVFDAREYVVAGGLMSYGPNIDAIYRQLATYVKKLLHGTPASELPIEQPTTFELVINLKAAKALGLTMPQSILARADKVIL
jgi:putative ABC transport system substrate-binding protein